MQRLDGREYQILMAEAPLPDDPSTMVPVVVQGVARDQARGDRPEADRSGRRLRHSVSSGPPRSLQLAWRDPARLARPGPFPRAHRRAGSLGDRAGLRRDRRQDEESLLRHARHARQLQFNIVKLEPAIDALESRLY
jgi:hypothetical protein